MSTSASLGESDDNGDDYEAWFSNLSPGMTVYVFCIKRRSWHPAKVVAVNVAQNSVKIHFVGYNKRHDRWVRAEDRHLRENNPSSS